MTAHNFRLWPPAAGIIFLIMIEVARAAATEPGASWTKRVWQTDDGLPAANVTGGVQTQDGYLWLATQSGLARFDGVVFQPVPIPVGRARPIIRAMLCDHAENLWLAEDGGVLVCFGADAARMFTTTNGLPDSQPLKMVETPDHSVWISYADGSVFRITAGNVVTRLTDADGLKDDGTCSLALDANGRLWCAKGYQSGFYAAGHFQAAGTLPERNPQILCARSGELWFATPTQLAKSVSNAAPATVAATSASALLCPSNVLHNFRWPPQGCSRIRPKGSMPRRKQRTSCAGTPSSLGPTAPCGTAACSS